MAMFEDLTNPISLYRNVLIQPRVIGYKKHPILPAEWMYIDIEERK